MTAQSLPVDINTRIFSPTTVGHHEIVVILAEWPIKTEEGYWSIAIQGFFKQLTGRKTARNYDSREGQPL